MGSLLLLSLLVALAAVIAVDANVLPVEEKFVPTADSDQAVITIIDIDEAVIGFDETFYDVGESDGVVVVTVRLLSGGLSSDVIVRLETQDGSAQDPDDYIGVMLLLTFSPTINQSDVSIRIKKGAVYEPNAENFVAHLALVTTNVNVQVSPDSATIQIIDDDMPIPQFEETVYTVPENDRSVPLCVDIGVFLAEPIAYIITAEHKDPAEAEDADFNSRASITVEPPGPRACIDFTDLVVNDNIAVEGDEAFQIVIEGTSAIAMVTIIDDDAPEIITPDVIVNEAEGPAEVCVELRNVIENSVILLYDTREKAGGATVNDDYIAANGSTSLTPGDTKTCITIDIIDDDDENEKRELFDVAFMPENIPSVLSIATIGIVDNDAAVIFNNSITGDPRFKVSLPPDGEDIMCYEVHGVADRFFNLISDTCLSVNSHFTIMPDQTNFNRMSTIGIRAATTADQAGGGCVNIQIDLENCAASIQGQPILIMESSEDIRIRKFGNRWRVSVPNCERPSVMMWITCELKMLRFDVARGSVLNPTSHGLLGQFWNIPIFLIKDDSGPSIQVNKLGEDNYRRFHALKYSLTWDRTEKECYYVGNFQGGPEFTHNPIESVIQGTYSEYMTSGLFDTSFKYQIFDDSVCDG